MHEPVWDGHRILARRYRSVVRLWSCDGQDWAGVFPAIVGAIRALPTESLIIDGEAVCLREYGSPEVHAPQSEIACREARLIAFDLLTLEGRDLRPNPLHERRTNLAFLLNEEPHDGHWLSSHVESMKEGPVPPRLRDEPRKHRFEVAGSPRQVRAVSGLAQDQVQGLSSLLIQFGKTGTKSPPHNRARKPRENLMKEWITVLKAADAAARWHVHQKRKGAAQEPYINHLLEIATLVAEATHGT
jgi:hypothetical protein